MFTARGVLGGFWGNRANIPNNVAALTIFLLLIFGIIVSICNMHKQNSELNLSIVELWGLIKQIIKLCISYLFGGKGRIHDEDIFDF